MLITVWGRDGIGKSALCDTLGILFARQGTTAVIDTDLQLVDSDLVKALHRLRERIDNRYRYDWCDVLVQCQRDRQLRYALSGIVARLGEMRRVQMETDTMIR